MSIIIRLPFKEAAMYHLLVSYSDFRTDTRTLLEHNFISEVVFCKILQFLNTIQAFAQEYKLQSENHQSFIIPINWFIIRSMGQTPTVDRNLILTEGAIWNLKRGTVIACGYGFKGVKPRTHNRDPPPRQNSRYAAPNQPEGQLGRLRTAPNVYTNQDELMRAVSNLGEDTHNFVNTNPNHRQSRHNRQQQLYSSEADLPHFQSEQQFVQTPILDHKVNRNQIASTAESKLLSQGMNSPMLVRAGVSNQTISNQGQRRSQQQIPQHFSSTSLDNQLQQPRQMLLQQSRSQQQMPQHQPVYHQVQQQQTHPMNYAAAHQPSMTPSYHSSEMPQFSNQHSLHNPNPNQMQYEVNQHAVQRGLQQMMQQPFPADSRYQPRASQKYDQIPQSIIHQTPQTVPLSAHHLAISPSVTHPYEPFPHQNHLPQPQSQLQQQKQYQPQPQSRQQPNRAKQRSFEFENRFLEILSDFKDHNVDFAYKKSQAFLTEFGEEFRNQPSYSTRMAFFKQIETQYKDVISYASEITKNKWVLKSDEKGVKISTFDQDGVACLVESQIDVPLQMFISVITQIDYHSKFIPFLTYSKQQKQISRNSKIGHCISQLPIISNRQVFFQGAGFNRLDTNGTIFFYTRSIHNHPQLLQKFNYQPHPKKGSVMLEYKYICLECTPLGLNKAHVKLCLNVDVKVGYAPKFMMESGMKKFGLEFYSNIIKVCRNFKGSEWQRAVQRKPELSDFFRKTINEYFSKKR